MNAIGTWRRGPVAAAAVAVLTMASLAVSTSSATEGQVPSTNTTDAEPAPPAPEAEPVTLDSVAPGIYEITLITGDTVELTVTAGSLPNVTDVEPAPRPDKAEDPSFEIQREPEGLHVYPENAMPAIQAGLVDRKLFNVEHLVNQGYTDAESGRLPLIVTYAEPPAAAHKEGASTDAAELVERADRLPATSDVVGLTSITGAGVEVRKESARRFWQQLQGTDAEQTTRDSGEVVEKVWLDERIEVDLDESVPLIGAPQAWDAGYDGTDVTVAVLDTGIDDTHPDVAGKIVDSKSFIGGDSVQDGHGHGTHVASTIAGAAAGDQYVGVAPGADLAIGKVLNDGGGGTTAGLIDGMEWAVEEAGADVVSLSLGSGPTDGSDPASQAVDNLTASSDALFVIAAGNDGPSAGTVSAPGAADAALTVAATDKNDQLASFSSRGPRLDGALKPDIAAPGVSIVAARAAGTSMGSPVNEHYTSASGTSMATPHVAGAAAILAQQHPGWTAAELKAALMSTATDAGYTAYQQGAGRVDVARLVSQQVFATAPSVDFGSIPFDDDSQHTGTMTYTNLTDQPVVLTLTPRLRTAGGESAPDGSLVADDTVTVPAGGEASVTITLDPNQLDRGLYTGTIVATDEATGVRLRTPVGVYREPRMVELTVHLLGREGRPVEFCYGQVDFDNGCWTTVSPRPVEYLEPRPDFVLGQGRNEISPGVLRLRVLPGTYLVDAWVRWWEGEGPLWNRLTHNAFLMDPELRIEQDTTITLDARQAEEITMTTPRPSVRPGSGEMRAMHWNRDSAFFEKISPSWPHDGSTLISGASGNLWVTPTERVTMGDFYFSSHFTLVNPEAEHRPRDIQYLYQLHAHEDLQIPESLDYVYDEEDLAEVDTSIHSNVPGPARHRTQPLRLDTVAQPYTRFNGPRQATFTQYKGPLSSDIVWEEQVDGWNWRVRRNLTNTSRNVYDKPTHTSERWNVVPFAPGSASFDVVEDAFPDLDSDPHWPGFLAVADEICTFCREGDTLWPIYYITAAYRDNSANGQKNLGTFINLNVALYKENGEEIPQTPQSGVFAGSVPTFTLPKEAGTYRLVQAGGAAGWDTTWTFTSPGTASHEYDKKPAYLCPHVFMWQRPFPEDACQPEPFLFLGYDLGKSLGLDNTIPAGGAHRFTVTAYNGQSAAAMPRIEGLKLWISTDGGEEWQSVRVVPHGRSTDGQRAFRAITSYPKLSETSGTVSLKAEAWDAAGNRVEQTLLDAYELRARR